MFARACEILGKYGAPLYLVHEYYQNSLEPRDVLFGVLAIQIGNVLAGRRRDRELRQESANLRYHHNRLGQYLNERDRSIEARFKQLEERPDREKPSDSGSPDIPSPEKASQV
jgi:hypothetical protein